MNFKRNAELQLLAWKNSNNRKPLVLKGARQVGKTSLIKLFGKSAFEKTAYFNFEENPLLKQFFEQSKDVNQIIQNLSLVFGEKIDSETTLIVFDEIQECYDALNSLKYFCENAPEYAIISAGSLLGITLGKSVSFPVGKVTFLEIHPLTFSEFLNGIDVPLYNYLNAIKVIEPIPNLLYQKLLSHFKQYFICGGMPEAAKTLVEEKDIEKTQKVLKDILSSYALDFSKHSVVKDIAKITHVWSSIPSQLAKENKKFLYQTVKQGARAREYEDALLWLIQAGLVYKINLNKKPNIPLSAYDDLSAFKLYLFDVGLLRSLAQIDPKTFINGNQLFSEFKGALSENYVLQSLITQFDVSPRYWTSDGIAEVDFLLQHGQNIYPIEVKSDENVRSKSLSFYGQKHQPKLKIRFSLKNLTMDNDVLNIPMFMADFSKKLIELSNLG